jgi:hypothetical protein
MISLRTRVVPCLLALAAAPSARAVTITHEGAGCVIADRFPRFEARLDPADEVARARVLFRAAGTPHWYSVDMSADASGFTGVLPKPRRATARIEYYVEASDRAFASTRTPERTVDVVGSAGECRRDVLVAPVSATARLVVTAAPGAPAVPAGFLGAGIAGAGGVGAGTLAVIGAGAAAAAGVAVGAGGGGGPDGDPPPTTLAEASIAGAWVGLGADGLHRDWTQSVSPTQCRHEDDLYLDLVQSGRSVTGAARYVSRVGATCEIPPGATFRTDVRGTIDGPQVRLTLSTTLPAGDYSEEYVGTVNGARMEGTVTGSWRDGPRSGQIRGTWSARRP